MDVTPEEKKVLDYMRDNNIVGSGYECSTFGIDKELGIVLFYNRHSAKGRSSSLSSPIVGAICHEDEDKSCSYCGGDGWVEDYACNPASLQMCTCNPKYNDSPPGTEKNDN